MAGKNAEINLRLIFYPFGRRPDNPLAYPLALPLWIDRHTGKSRHGEDCFPQPDGLPYGRSITQQFFPIAQSKGPGIQRRAVGWRKISFSQLAVWPDFIQ